MSPRQTVTIVTNQICRHIQGEMLPLLPTQGSKHIKDKHIKEKTFLFQIWKKFLKKILIFKYFKISYFKLTVVPPLLLWHLGHTAPSVLGSWERSKISEVWFFCSLSGPYSEVYPSWPHTDDLTRCYPGAGGPILETFEAENTSKNFIIDLF